MKLRSKLLSLAMLLCVVGGVSANDTRVIGGKPATIEANPWQVALVLTGDPASKMFCGGTLIAERWVMTAAHCLHFVRASQVEVITATDNLEEGGIRHSVEELHMPEFYKAWTVTNDITLLKLSQPSAQQTINYKVSPEDEAAGTPATTSGWGTVSPTERDYPSQLQIADLEVVSYASCNAAYQELGKTLDREAHMCATSNPYGQADSCYGDSGGPLVTNVNGQNTVIGIVSFGYACADDFFPGVYTRVSGHDWWIHRTINELGYGTEPKYPGVPAVFNHEGTNPTPEPIPVVVTEPQPGDAKMTVEKGFGDVRVGEESTAIVRVTNSATGFLTIVAQIKVLPTTVMLDISNCDGALLGPSESCTIQLFWTPTEEGAFEASLAADVWGGYQSAKVAAVITGNGLSARNDVVEIVDANTAATFLTASQQDWIVDYDFSVEGGSSLQTGEIVSADPVVLEADFDVAVDSTLSFAYTVEAGSLSVVVDGVSVLELQAAANFETASVNVAAGSSVSWSFTPDRVSQRTMPKARIDNVTLVAGATGGAAGGGALSPLSAALMLSIAGIAGGLRRKVK